MQRRTHLFEHMLPPKVTLKKPHNANLDTYLWHIHLRHTYTYINALTCSGRTKSDAPDARQLQGKGTSQQLLTVDDDDDAEEDYRDSSKTETISVFLSRRGKHLKVLPRYLEKIDMDRGEDATVFH